MEMSRRKERTMAKEIMDQAKVHFSSFRENDLNERNSLHEGDRNMGTYEPTENFHKVFSKIIGEHHTAHTKPDGCVRNGQCPEPRGDAETFKEGTNENHAKDNDDGVHISRRSDAQEFKGKLISDGPQHVSVFEKLSGIKIVEEAVDEKRR